MLVTVTLVQALPLLWRRQAPLTVLVLMAMVFVASHLVWVRQSPADFGLLVALYGAGRYARASRAVIGACTWLAVAVAVVLSDSRLSVLDGVLFAAVGAALILAGRRTKSRDRAASVSVAAAGGVHQSIDVPLHTTGPDRLPLIAVPKSALSPREAEVLGMLAEGMSNGEIAEALVVSRETVKSHVSHILAKLGARDRTQAAVIALRSGLLAEASS